MSAPRPRRTVCFRSQPGASRLPAPIAELIAGDDPALHAVLQAVLDAQLAGQDITDPAVLAACVHRSPRESRSPRGRSPHGGSMKAQRQSECSHCGAVTPDGVELCQDASTELLTVLRRLPGLIEDLDVTLSRQDSMGEDSGGRRSTETPLVFREDASTQLGALRTVLVRWTSYAAPVVGIAELPDIPATVDPHDPARIRPAVTISLLAARALADHIDGLRSMRHVGDLAREITDAAREAERAVDKRVHRVYVGPCGAETEDEDVCEVQLYASADSPSDDIQCPGCSAIWSIYERRAWLIGAAGEHTARASEVAALVRRTGLQIATATVRQWACRGEIPPVDWDDSGNPLYSVRSVLEYAAMTPKQRKGVRQGREKSA